MSFFHVVCAALNLGSWTRGASPPPPSDFKRDIHSKIVKGFLSKQHFTGRDYGRVIPGPIREIVLTWWGQECYWLLMLTGPSSFYCLLPPFCTTPQPPQYQWTKGRAKFSLIFFHHKLFWQRFLFSASISAFCVRYTIFLLLFHHPSSIHPRHYK